MARKLEWKCKKEDDGFIEYTSTDGEWSIDNCLNKPPCVDADEWEGWDLYLIDGKDKDWVGSFSTPEQAKKEAQDIVQRDEKDG